MPVGNYSKGWGSQNDYDDYGRGSGDDGGENRNTLTENQRLYRFRFTVPTPDGTTKQPNLTPGGPATKRVLFLDGEPFVLREHGMWTPDNKFRDAYKTIGAFTAICLEANQLHEKCPLCAPNGGDMYSYSIGFFPVIDMGQVLYEAGKLTLLHETWTSSRGKVYDRKFQRVLLGAKKGSQEKPGVLKTLQFQMQKLQDRHGWKDLTGTVWDTTRNGKQDAAVGGSWEFVERILPDDWEEYLIRHGAERDSLNLEAPVYSNDRDGVFDFDVKEQYDKLSELVGWGSAPSKEQKRPDATARGAGYGGSGNTYAQGGPYGQDAPPPDDDDIPF